MPEARFVEVYRAENGVEAHLLKGALEDAGIPTKISEESVAALEPNIWWAAPRLFVAEEDAAKAAAVIRDLESERAIRRSQRKTD